MDIALVSLVIASVSTLTLGWVLVKYVLLKRRLFKLKQRMKAHQLAHGFDNTLWVMFTEQTRKMLKE
tara:strand:- start:62 stop:262 length:201 start_codon:yes stop_codon:yes gene_type:complete